MNVHLQTQAQARINKLTFLLDKSTIYAKIIGDRMARQQIEKRKAEKRAETIKANKEKKGDAVQVRESTRDKKPKVKEEEVEEGGKRKRRGDATGAAKKVKLEDEVSYRVIQGIFGVFADSRNPSSRKRQMVMTRNRKSRTRKGKKRKARILRNTPSPNQLSSPVPSFEITSWQVYNG
jgi:hypothetical protein